MKHAAAVALLAGLPCVLRAQVVHPEVEPNDTKAQANGPLVMVRNDSILGLSTGSSTIAASPGNADYFLVKTGPIVHGIYRHSLALSTSTASGHIGTLRGLTQTSGTINPGTDAVLQTSTTSTTPARAVAWYGFGKEEQVYYRVTGVAGTTADYTAVLDTTPITPTDLGTLPGGFITITSFNQGHTTNTELWVYDSHFDAIPGYGNDSEPAPGTSTHARLSRDFSAAGDYYLAISSSNLANHHPAPADDRLRTGAVQDFPGAATSSVTTTGQNVSFVITDGAGVDHPVAAIKDNAFDIVWFKFTLTAPVTGACCLPDAGTCADGSAGFCAAQGGVYHGDGTACASVTCPMGACCHADGTCTMGSPGLCAAQGGVYQGAATTCGITCPQPAPGACCFNDGTCSSLTFFACGPAGGSWLGANTQCATTECPLIIISNMPGNDGTQSANLEGGRIKAMGFTIPAGTDYSLSHVEMRLDFSSLDVSPLIRLYDDTGNAPTNLLVTLTSPQVTATGFQTYSVTPPQPFTLQAGAKYWVVVYNQGGGSIDWKASSPFQALTGIATHSGSLFSTATGPNPPPSTATSSTINSYAVKVHAGAAPQVCYANCDASTTIPFLNVADFTCFLQRFAAAEPYANCDGSTTVPVLNVADFTCFLQKFAASCSAP